MPEALPPALIWIDGVGGFLVLRSDTVTLGPAFAEPAPDVPIFADISRDHATIHRDGEGYWLRSERALAVNLAPAKRALLQSGDRITLGASCQLQFRKAEPLCASAGLTLISGHRFGHPVDAALLMADALIVDRSPHAHIQADLPQRVVIFRQGSEFGLKAASSIRAAGQAPGKRAILKPGVPTTVEGVTITVELC